MRFRLFDDDKVVATPSGGKTHESYAPCGRSAVDGEYTYVLTTGRSTNDPVAAYWTQFNHEVIVSERLPVTSSASSPRTTMQRSATERGRFALSFISVFNDCPTIPRQDDVRRSVEWTRLARLMCLESTAIAVAVYHTPHFDRLNSAQPPCAVLCRSPEVDSVSLNLTSDDGASSDLLTSFARQDHCEESDCTSTVQITSALHVREIAS